MKLETKIRDIAARWFDPTYAHRMPIQRIVSNLAEEAFRKIMDQIEHDLKHYREGEDYAAIRYAMIVLDRNFGLAHGLDCDWDWEVRRNKRDYTA